MTPEQFVKYYYPQAKKVQDRTGMSAIALLAQSAHETGWGKKAVGNMMFGVKDTDGINGNEQLITTTEFHSTAKVKYPVIISIVKIGNKFKYTIKDWFRKYDSAEQSFLDHANFLIRNPRYKNALLVKSDPYKFLSEIAKAGYATDPNYGKVMGDMIYSVIKRLPK
ncbi:MAG: glucosaminidase domain-containing protein [Flavobacterium sp.]|nr:glucosaminidase domain-containing protein [Flavobacterium sp.]